MSHRLRLGTVGPSQSGRAGRSEQREHGQGMPSQVPVGCQWGHELGAGTCSLRPLFRWPCGPQAVAEHCRSVLVREGVRAGPSIEGGTVFVRVRCRLRDNGDMNSELVLVPCRVNSCHSNLIVVNYCHYWNNYCDYSDTQKCDLHRYFM